MSNDWRARARRPDEALELIKSGMRVFVHEAAATPAPLLEALARRGDVEDLRRPEVIVCIMISHNGRFDQPVDASEEICLKQMISRLTELGVWTRQLKAPQNHSTPFVRSRVEKRRWSFYTLGTASP